MGLFGDAFKFPFRPFKRLWWFWLNAIPVLGWLLYAGYVVDLISHIVEGNDEMPAFGPFWHTLKIGFVYTIISIILGWLASLFLFIPIPFVGWVFWIIAVILIPIMMVQYAVSREFLQGFNVWAAFKLVFGHFWKYLVYNLCMMIIALIWLVASLPIITLLITIPAMSFAGHYLFARFYRETSGYVSISLAKPIPVRRSVKRTVKRKKKK